jgi:hypothetical protein
VGIPSMKTIDIATTLLTPHQQGAPLRLIFQAPKIPCQFKVTLGSNKKPQADYPIEN